ncbi:MAG: hypothetical protein U1C51_09870 [Candidatus Izemoplasmatales bacterium]|jgi:hypothetical protein|nr:HD domain-containing protein [bacterium]MDZ4197536.1 hypothetical protein [Candidatus Izemoplasmatales bacterium]
MQSIVIDYSNPVDSFVSIFKQYIKREGSDKLLLYLLSQECDFFSAPASTRFHLSKKSGLVIHSLHVLECLVDYVSRPRMESVYQFNPSTESVVIVALLHDLCKINVYKPSKRNVKDKDGKWKEEDTYEFRDELPYGHGEKSVYIISGFMRLTREEAFAIRYHMGFSGTEDKMSVGSSFERFPLAFALSTADMEATFFLEKN